MNSSLQKKKKTPLEFAFNGCGFLEENNEVFAVYQKKKIEVFALCNTCFGGQGPASGPGVACTSSRENVMGRALHWLIIFCSM